jgi:hypothetical protein
MAGGAIDTLLSLLQVLDTANFGEAAADSTSVFAKAAIQSSLAGAK